MAISIPMRCCRAPGGIAHLVQHLTSVFSLSVPRLEVGYALKNPEKKNTFFLIEGNVGLLFILLGILNK